MGKYVRTYVDYDGEATTFQVKAADLTAANFDAQVALQVALGAATNGICLGALKKIEYGNVIDSPVLESDEPTAQRELKWLVKYHDATTADKLRLTIGTADPAALDPNARKQAYIGDGDVVDAFVTAFEAYVLSPLGNAVEIDQIVLVGRNI